MVKEQEERMLVTATVMIMTPNRPTHLAEMTINSLNKEGDGLVTTEDSYSSRSTVVMVVVLTTTSDKMTQPTKIAKKKKK
jgi:Tfp pilus assembly protein PilZ